MTGSPTSLHKHRIDLNSVFFSLLHCYLSISSLVEQTEDVLCLHCSQYTTTHLQTCLQNATRIRLTMTSIILMSTNTIESFSEHVPKISGQPNYATLKSIHDALKANAFSYATTLAAARLPWHLFASSMV